jgi:hypothetical protein
MAKKKRKKTRSVGLSASRTHKITPRRKSRRRKMLSASMEDAGKTTISGAFGGAVSLLFDYVIPSTANPAWKGAAKIAGGFAVAKFTNMKGVGAGMAGAGVAELLKPKLGLSEGGANWAKPMESLPMFLTENGMQLSQGQAQMMLAADAGNKQPANSYLPNYMPQYL